MMIRHKLNHNNEHVGLPTVVGTSRNPVESEIATTTSHFRNELSQPCGHHRMRIHTKLQFVLCMFIFIFATSCYHSTYTTVIFPTSCHALVVPESTTTIGGMSSFRSRPQHQQRTQNYPQNTNRGVRLTLFPSDVGTSMFDTTKRNSMRRNDKKIHQHVYTSPLFSSQPQRIRRQQREHQSPSSTALSMVLTTPESIIEQASTINLLDDLIDESVRTSARRPIMMQFDPSSGWIWRRWSGTVFAETWTSCVRNMVYALCVYAIQRSYPCINRNLSGFGTLWGQLLSVTTFTLTFFVNQSYSLWRKCMELSRRLQGRLHDINMNLVTHAARKVPSNPNEKSTYTASSRQILELMSRYVRLFNLLTYASFTRSHRPILTPRGMRRLVERGLMTATEREVLVDAAVPATQRHSVVLMWMIRLFIEGREAGHILGGAGFEQETMNKFHIIRSQYGAIGDELQGRMPLAYAHIVQVLVDLILWMFPIMAFSTGMSPLLVIVGTGLLTISYQGLFDLAKQFLDPYDNENYGRGEDPLSVDTLIAETNAGSVRWLYGFEEMPYSAQRVRDGEMYDYLLPVRGYSVEELAQMEEERIEREKQLEEQRKREEEETAEKLRKESEETDSLDKAELDESLQDASSPPSVEIIDRQVGNQSITVDNTNATKSRESLRKKTSKKKSIVGNTTGLAGNEATQQPLDGLVVQNLTETLANVSSTLNTSSLPKESARTLHKVTRLATGKAVTFMPPEIPKEVVEEPVPSDIQTTNYLATLSMGETTSELDTGGKCEPDMSDVRSLDDFQWVNETGPDGEEIRLSQHLADEEWPKEAADVETKTITWEENQERVKEIKENAENELQETVEILSASPGADGNEELYTVKERKKKVNPTYDQTRLDGISQLRGLPPQDPSALAEYEPPEKIEDNDFDTIAQLRGSRGSGKTRDQSEKEESEVVGLTSSAGISDLWGNTLDEFRDGGVENDSIDQQGNGASRDDLDIDGDVDDQSGSYSGIPLRNERGKDGKEYRLSQSLADEEWDVESEEKAKTAMTLEDYNKQVEEILSQAEEEMRETEAILLSKPGTDPLGWDYDEDKLAPMSEDGDDVEIKNEETTVPMGKEVDGDDDLTALGMDTDEDVADDAVNANREDIEKVPSNPAEDSSQSVNGDFEDAFESSTNSTDTVERDRAIEDTAAEVLEEEAILMSKPGDDPVGWDYDEEQLAPMEENSSGSDPAMDKIKNGDSENKDEESMVDVNVDTVEKEAGVNRNDAKGSDIVQPIFLESEPEEESHTSEEIN